MGIVNEDFAVQSFCFRTIKDNAAVAEAVKQIGLSKIEVCAVHCKFGDESTHDATIQAYQDAGVQIVAIGVEGMSDDEAENRKRFEFMKKCGARFMSVNFFPATFEKAHPIVQKLCEEYDVKVGIHNHGGYHWLGNTQMLDHVFGQLGDRIGLCMDTAWALDAKANPVEWVKRFGPRLFGIHLKDFIFHRNRNHEDVVVGTGNVDLPALVQAAEEAGFAGVSTMEYEGDPDNPVPTLTQCVEAIQATA